MKPIANEINRDENLLNMSFEAKQVEEKQSLEVQEPEVEISVEKMLLGMAHSKGIMVTSVAVPENWIKQKGRKLF